MCGCQLRKLLQETTVNSKTAAAALALLWTKNEFVELLLFCECLAGYHSRSRISMTRQEKKIYRNHHHKKSFIKLPRHALMSIIKIFDSSIKLVIAQRRRSRWNSTELHRHSQFRQLDGECTALAKIPTLGQNSLLYLCLN